MAEWRRLGATGTPENAYLRGAHNGGQVGRIGRQARVRCNAQPTESVELSGLCLACIWPYTTSRANQLNAIATTLPQAETSMSPMRVEALTQTSVHMNSMSLEECSALLIPQAVLTLPSSGLSLGRLH